MADFKTTLSAHPAIKNVVDPAALDGLISDAVLQVSGAHKWPFLFSVNRTLTWTANQTTKTFPDLSFVETVRYPETGGRYRELILKDDSSDFSAFKYNNSGSTRVSVWRNAGATATGRTIELFAVPTTNAALLCDVYTIPNTGQIESLPSFFNKLVRMCILSEIPNSGISVVNYDYSLREAISRYDGMATDHNEVQVDEVFRSRMMGIMDL